MANRHNLIGFGAICGAVVIGTFTAIAVTDIATLKSGFCDARPACLRDWVGALGGWAATVGALATIVVLWKTLTQMRGSSERQLRAYIAVDRAFIEGLGTPNVRIKTSYKNFGQTPAHEVRMRGQWWFHLRGEENFDLAVNWMAMPELGPGAFYVQTNAIDGSEFLRLQPQLLAHQVGFYIYGELTYQDAFRRTRKTCYRFRLTVDRAIVDGDFELLPDGNWSN